MITHTYRFKAASACSVLLYACTCAFEILIASHVHVTRNRPISREIGVRSTGWNAVLLRAWICVCALCWLIVVHVITCCMRAGVHHRYRNRTERRSTGRFHETHAWFARCTFEHVHVKLKRNEWSHDINNGGLQLQFKTKQASKQRRNAITSEKQERRAKKKQKRHHNNRKSVKNDLTQHELSEETTHKPIHKTEQHAANTCNKQTICCRNDRYQINCKPSFLYTTRTWCIQSWGYQSSSSFHVPVPVLVRAPV